MDANFRAISRPKDGTGLDQHLHAGQMFFRDYQAFQQYLARVTEASEVCESIFIAPSVAIIKFRQASTCSGFKAGDLTREGRYAKLLASGILCLVCSRHGLFYPDAAVDLQKGERYVNGDYALYGALQRVQQLPRIKLIYDVNCQYSKKLKQRFQTNFAKPPSLDNIDFLVPKAHLPGHKDDCVYEYSPNFIEGSGRTDGEALERDWALMNPLATSTREMGTAHRHEVLEDHMNEINFKKVSKMRAYIVASYVFRYFPPPSLAQTLMN